MLGPRLLQVAVTVPLALTAGCALLVPVDDVVLTKSQSEPQPSIAKDSGSRTSERASQPPIAGSTGQQMPADAACPEHVAADSPTIFVSPTGTDGECGSVVTPCLTIRRALELVEQTKRMRVVLEEGTYGEAVNLKAGVKLQGGWTRSDTGWSRPCEPLAQSTIASPDATGLTASYSGDASVDRIEVRTKVSTTPGGSQYGIVVNAPTAHLELIDVSVWAGPGGDGATGTGLAVPSRPFNCNSPGNGTDGRDGDPGASGRPGTFSSSGYVPSNGVAGKPGEPGGNGTASPEVLEFECPGSYDGAFEFPKVPLACGGDGGGGGDPGYGGGSSVALFVWEGTVQVTGGKLQAESAGKGAAGRAGAPGTAAERSEAKVIVPDKQFGNCPGGWTLNRGVNDGLGTPGRPGGHGGNGGRGGAGAGGCSFSLFKGPKAVVMTSSTTSLEHGNAGGSDGGQIGSAASIGGPGI